MSKNTTKVVDSERRTDTIVGIVTVLVVLALVAWLFISMSIRGKALSPVAYEGETRRGNEQTFTANVKTSKIKDGTPVKWIVNGEVVNEGIYTEGEPLTLNYAPKTSGTNYVTVQIGKYNQTAYVDVLPPQLTLSAPNLVITYGDGLPDFTYECTGFVGDDTADMLNYNGEYYLYNDYNEPVASLFNDKSASRISAGVYKLNLERNCCFNDYEINYVEGTLTVLPKHLNVDGRFVKTYDSCNAIDNPHIKLDGVEAGDDVRAECDKLYFDNKNVGENKTVMLANVELAGKDSCNYVLEGTACGTILPKQVEITGLTIRDKMYDGTTKAQIDTMGALDGVIAGDSVAIGSLELSFAEATAGEQEIVLNNVSLVGADKDNYQVVGVDVESATINDTVWNKIFVKNPVATASE